MTAVETFVQIDGLAATERNTVKCTTCLATLADVKRNVVIVKAVERLLRRYRLTTYLTSTRNTYPLAKLASLIMCVSIHVRLFFCSFCASRSLLPSSCYSRLAQLYQYQLSSLGLSGATKLLLNPFRRSYFFTPSIFFPCLVDFLRQCHATSI